MKKTVWVFGVTLLLLLGVGFVCGQVSNSAAKEMCALADEIQYAADLGDFDSAKATCHELFALWEKKEALLQLWTVHEDTDDVSVLIRKLTAAVDMESRLHTALLCEETYMSIEHLYHRDAPFVKNIF